MIYYFIFPLFISKLFSFTVKSILNEFLRFFILFHKNDISPQLIPNFTTTQEGVRYCFGEEGNGLMTYRFRNGDWPDSREDHVAFALHQSGGCNHFQDGERKWNGFCGHILGGWVLWVGWVLCAGWVGSGCFGWGLYFGGG